MTKIPEDLSYTKEHEWVRLQDSLGSIGITDFAQSELGDVVFVELPEIGARFRADDPLATVESVKAVSDVYAPLAGEVVEINEKLIEEPELVNADPYGDGWMVKLRVNDSEQSTLLDPDQYADYLREESGE